MKEDIQEELRFWDGWLRVKGKNYEQSNRLLERFSRFIGEKKKVKIADLGSGPVCLIGDKRRDVEVEVISSDVLVDEYNELLKKYNIKPANPVQKQDFTNLTYDDESFDIVYCSNTLDHCLDPYKALQEMLRICKKYGWIYLVHFAHEGQRHRYRNMHKWNLDMTEDEDCIIWNDSLGPKTDNFLLSEIYSEFKTTLKPTRRVSIITSIAQKVK